MSPCYDPPGTYGPSCESCADIRKKLDERTDMLCRVMTVVENYERAELNQGHDPSLLLDGVPKDVLEWWIAHKKWDAKRLSKAKGKKS